MDSGVMDNNSNDSYQAMMDALNLASSSSASSQTVSDSEDSSATSPAVAPSVDGSRRWQPRPGAQTRTRGSTESMQSSSTAVQLQPVAQHDCRQPICSMAKVFETTELLEMVLGHLETPDVVQLQRTCKHWLSLVNKSPQLRVNLFVHAQWNRDASKFQLLNINLPGLHSELDEPINLGRWIHISMSVKAARIILDSANRHLPTRPQSISRNFPADRTYLPGLDEDLPGLHGDLQYGRLQVVQPPVIGMQAFITPSKQRQGGADGVSSLCAKLACDAGITLGFLAETTLSLLTDGKNKHNPDENRSIVYTAIISFCAPVVALRKRSLVRTVTSIEW
ncbi:uncharacterized protein RCC_10312 [Ramularia collo-cygni]|uniref:F-box domain-containing protein n=1 Tax=Ramularia collo-cygni TaxID=112498 RepID=A0A2D3V2U4_9PEZI|nr:uncharacterized protein RCC_10312 [Ramularia collo-cygni]CZT24587.1 uncharacterized protein RCC_10312 [Ramularia collo-cygni]